MGHEPTVVLVVPIVPAPTGNGLAMRAGMLLQSLTPAAAVHVVVVPVSGPVGRLDWVRARARSVAVVEPVDAATAKEHTTRQLADTALRAQLTATAPLPGRATLAPPTLADAARIALPTAAVAPLAVLVMRSYLAPLGVRLGRLLGASRIVIDADEDDGALLRALGDAEEADAFDRLAREWYPLADAVTVASERDVDGLTARLDVAQLEVVPNAVRVPEQVVAPPRRDRLLMVGNLTYVPNVEAVGLLANEILPRVRRSRPTAVVELVGACDRRVRELGTLAGVEVVGPVPDVDPHYAAADVVVVPLRHGGGTRIKVLEAFAQRRPLVATPEAVAGLDVGQDEAVIATSIDDLAGGVLRVLADPDGVADRVAQSFEVVRARFAPDVVGARVRAVVLGGPG